MSDSYRAFIRNMKLRMVEMNLSPRDAASLINVSLTTLYNWMAFRTIMSGDDMIKVIRMIMGGWHEVI